MSDSNNTRTPTEDEFKDFVGDNSYKFIKARNKFLSGKYYSSSAMAMLFAPVYGPYYRYWTPLWVNLGLILVSIIMYEAYEDHERVESLSQMLGIMLAVFYGCFYRYFYIRFAHRKICKLKELEQDPERLKRLLAKRGNPSKLSLLMALIIIISALLIADFAGALGTTNDKG